MPLETIDAYQDHGPRPRVFGPEEIAAAHGTISSMAGVGIDYDDVMDTLETEGVDKFIASWNDLVSDVESQL
jgi:transaldolase